MPTPFTKSMMDEARTVPIKLVLSGAGLYPVREYANRYLYDCPIHAHLDKKGNRLHGGFSVYKDSNRYQCFLSGKSKQFGGSVIDIHMAVFHKDLTESISILLTFLPNAQQKTDLATKSLDM